MNNINCISLLGAYFLPAGVQCSCLITKLLSQNINNITTLM